MYSGFALPVPLIVGIVSRAYRDDARRLNRFTSRDWAWLRSRTRRDGSDRGRQVQRRPEAQRRAVRRLDRRPADLGSGHVLHQPRPAVVAQRRDVRARLVRARRRPARRRSHRDGHQGPATPWPGCAPVGCRCAGHAGSTAPGRARSPAIHRTRSPPNLSHTPDLPQHGLDIPPLFVPAPDFLSGTWNRYDLPGATLMMRHSPHLTRQAIGKPAACSEAITHLAQATLEEMPRHPTQSSGGANWAGALVGRLA